jgi:SAM-dependent methyltransferase
VTRRRPYNDGMKHVARPTVRDGYDLWADTYDGTPNPLVALDRRYTPRHLQPRSGEQVLDAGCGTGAHLKRIADAGARPVGLDFSRGMLTVARRVVPDAALAQADLNREMPVRPGRFDAVLCALVSEHLQGIRTLFASAFASLRPAGRLVFSAFHPEVAAAGVEASFDRDGTEYRLGAERYRVDDYLAYVEDAGFRDVSWREYDVDGEVVEHIPAAAKYLGRPLLLVIDARRPHGDRASTTTE